MPNTSNPVVVHTANVVEDPDHPGELLLDLGHKICDSLGWKIGDTVQWTDNKDGSWTLSKLDTKQSP